MNNDRKPSLDFISNYLSPFNQEKGGRSIVEGWSPQEWDSLGEYIREAFKSSSFTHPSFNSTYELIEFINGTGSYSEVNSFFYTDQDRAEFDQEGFFEPLHCPECLEDLKSQLEGDSIPDEKIVDPRIIPYEQEYQTKSYKPGQEKYVNELWYQCVDHPEVKLMKKESRYE